MFGHVSDCRPMSPQVPNELDDTLDKTKDDESLDVDVMMDELRNLYKYWKTEHTSSFELGQVFKSTADSVRLRNLGNDALENKCCNKALELFTQSVASAPEGSEELILTYGRRSAVSFRFGLWESCILDINRALKGKYLEHLERKILICKKETCLMTLQNGGKNKRRAKLVENETNPLRLKDTENDATWNQVCRFGNPLLPKASSKIYLKNNDQYGRFVAALKDIEPGEILSSQKLLSWMVDPEEQYEYCSYCLSYCIALISCPSCDQMYCSEQCCTEAYNQYHRVECKLSSFKVIREMSSDDKMALRMFLIGLKQGNELDKLMKILPIKKIFDEATDPTGKPFVNDYLSALKMCRTFPAKITRSAARVAIEIVVLLQKVGFFGRDRQNSNLSANPDDNLNEAELFATMLLTNNVVSVRSYWFRICAENYNFEKLNEKAMGYAICSLHNFLNHSCDPNANLFLRNKEHVLFATRPIAQGEQIFVSYCYPFARCPFEERRKRTSTFGFTCVCEPCVDEWPVHKVLLKEILDTSDTDLPLSELKFLVGNKKKAITELERTVWSALQKKKALSNREVLSICCMYLKWLHTNLKRPFPAHTECQELLNYCMFLLYDDFHRSKRTLDIRELERSEKLLIVNVNHVLQSYVHE